MLGIGDGVQASLPVDALMYPSKVLDSAAYVTHVFTKDAFDRLSPTALTRQLHNTVRNVGDWVMETVNGKGFADHLIDDGEMQKVKEAETFLQVAEFTHDDEAQQLQIRSIVHILGRSFVKKVVKGETMLEDSKLQLKNFVHQLNAEDLVAKAGLTVPELRVLQKHFDLGDVEDLLVAREVVDGLKRAFTG